MHTVVCAVVCQRINRVMVKEVQVELLASSAGWDRAARSSDSLNNQQEFAECGFLSCGATESFGLQFAASLASEHLFFFFLLSPPLAAGNRSHVAVEICPVCVLAHAFWCVFHRAQQEPEEAVRAAHQVLFPGRGSERAPLSSVPRRRGEHQRAMVGASPPAPAPSTTGGPASSIVSKRQVSVLVYLLWASAGLRLLKKVDV